MRNYKVIAMVAELPAVTFIGQSQIHRIIDQHEAGVIDVIQFEELTWAG